MSQREITATSGRMNSLVASTGSEKTESAGWSSRTVLVKVPGSSRNDRLTILNDRLRGSSGKVVNTSK